MAASCSSHHFLAILAVATLLTQVALAQSSQMVVSPAPVPTQILTAKKVFVANAPGDPNSLGGPNRAYNEFYAAAKNWGHYEIVSSVAEADLVFAISFTSSIFSVSGSSSTGCSSSDAQYLRLEILDAKTGVPLWWFAQFVSGFHSSASFTRSIGTLIDDLKNITGPPTVGHP